MSLSRPAGEYNARPETSTFKSLESMNHVIVILVATCPTQARCGTQTLAPQAKILAESPASCQYAAVRTKFVQSHTSQDREYAIIPLCFRSFRLPYKPLLKPNRAPFPRLLLGFPSFDSASQPVCSVRAVVCFCGCRNTGDVAPLQ